MAVTTRPESTMEDETLQILASSVFLRSNDTPLGAVATALNLSKHDQVTVPENEDIGNTFQNVHYYSDSEPSTPTFFNCQLENVDFVQCRFQNTEFCNLTLKNVTFFYVDCYNASFSNLHLKDCIWQFAIAQNAFLVHKSTEDIGDSRITTLEPFKPFAARHFEEEVVLAARRVYDVPLKTVMDMKRYENSFRGSVRVAVTPRRGTLLVRMVDRKNIVSQIIGNCYEPDHFFERKPLNDIVTFRNRADSDSASKAIHVFCPDSTDDRCFMPLILSYISTVKPTMVCESLHGPYARIQRKVICPGKLQYCAKTTLVLHYQFEGGTSFIKTHDQTWHSLMNHICHQASHLTNMHLAIGKGFWDVARWRDGAREVLEQTSLRNSHRNSGFPNFLAEVARIAAPADRWRDHDYRKEPDYDSRKDLDYAFNGTTLTITIDGTESEEQQDFVRELEDVVHELRTARPFFRPLSSRTDVYTRTDEEREPFRKRAEDRRDSF